MTTNTTPPTELVPAPLTSTPEAIASITVADLGNNLSQVGAIYEVGGQATVKLVAIPSKRSLHGASLAKAKALRGGKLGPDDHVLGFDVNGVLVEEFVGDLALAGDATAARGSNTRYTDGWTLRPLLAGIVATHPITANYIETVVYTVVPAGLHATIAPGVEAALTGTWKFQHNGRPVTVKILKVVVEREGQVAYHALVSDLPNVASQRSLINDWGARTINLALWFYGEFQGATQLELGVDFILDDAMSSLPRTLDERERQALKNALRDGQPYSIRHNYKPFQVDTLVRPYFDNAVSRVIQEIGTAVDLGTMDVVPLIGGGAHFTAATYKVKVPTIWTPARDPERVTIRALLALAAKDYGKQLPKLPKSRSTK